MIAPPDLKLSVDLNKEQRSTWETLTSTRNDWSNDVDDTEENERENNPRFHLSPHWCSCCFQGFLLGALTAGLILGIIIALWLTSGKTSTTTSTTQTMNLFSNSPSNVTTSTVTTSTSSTSKSSTSSSSTSRTTTTTTPIPSCATWLWNTTGETVAGTSGSAGNAANQLSSPWNIYIDPTNNYLYITDKQNHRIQLWLPGASNGSTVAGSNAGTAGSTANLLNQPKDVFVDSSQNIYVADSLNNRIQFFLNGTTTGVTVSSSWSGLGQLWGVQVMSQSIFACDNTQSTVWNNASVVAGHNGVGSAASQLDQPQGFAVDTSVAPGTVYVANSQLHTIVQWTVGALTGTVVAGVIGISGGTSTLLSYPVSLKLDNYTNMFVVDNNNHRIQLFCRYPTVNMTARTIAGTGVSGSTPQTFDFPAGVALDTSLNLYVSDTSNHRIQRFQRLQ